MSAEGRRSPALVRSTIGIPKASVFPDPVGDFARMSSPASASGRTDDWIAKGSLIERAARASTTDADTPSSRKDCCDTLFNSFFHVRESPSPNVRRRNEKLFSRAGRIADPEFTVAVGAGGEVSCRLVHVVRALPDRLRGARAVRPADPDELARLPRQSPNALPVRRRQLRRHPHLWRQRVRLDQRPPRRPLEHAANVEVHRRPLRRRASLGLVWREESTGSNALT